MSTWKPYSDEYQKEVNQSLVKTINQYWKTNFGVKANAQVRERIVSVPEYVDGMWRTSPGRKVKSYEIVSSVSKFPFMDEQE